MRQQLVCTECRQTLTFTMDFGKDGNHEITCPQCGHVHYRVVQNGRITEVRWRSSMTSYVVTNITLSSSSIADTASGGRWFLADSWLNGSTSGTSAASTTSYWP